MNAYPIAVLKESESPQAKWPVTMTEDKDAALIRC
jgi:hypothetical protein